MSRAVYKALFRYNAIEDDELHIEPGEELEIVQTFDDGEDEWVHVKNSQGRVGLVPKKFIKQILPNGWSCIVDEATGDEYYYHEASRVSQWEVPTTSRPVSRASSPNQVSEANSISSLNSIKSNLSSLVIVSNDSIEKQLNSPPQKKPESKKSPSRMEMEGLITPVKSKPVVESQSVNKPTENVQKSDSALFNLSKSVELSDAHQSVMNSPMNSPMANGRKKNQNSNFIVVSPPPSANQKIAQNVGKSSTPAKGSHSNANSNRGTPVGGSRRNSRGQPGLLATPPTSQNSIYRTTSSNRRVNQQQATPSLKSPASTPATSSSMVNSSMMISLRNTPGGPATVDLINKLVDDKLAKQLEIQEVRIIRQVKDLLLQAHRAENKSSSNVLESINSKSVAPENYHNNIAPVQPHQDISYSPTPEKKLLSLMSEPTMHDSRSEGLGNAKYAQPNFIPRAKSMSTFDNIQEETEEDFKATVAAVLNSADLALDADISDIDMESDTEAARGEGDDDHSVNSKNSKGSKHADALFRSMSSPAAAHPPDQFNVELPPKAQQPPDEHLNPVDDLSFMHGEQNMGVGVDAQESEHFPVDPLLQKELEFGGVANESNDPYFDHMHAANGHDISNISDSDKSVSKPKRNSKRMKKDSKRSGSKSTHIPPPLHDVDEIDVNDAASPNYLVNNTANLVQMSPLSPRVLHPENVEYFSEPNSPRSPFLPPIGVGHPNQPMNKKKRKEFEKYLSLIPGEPVTDPGALSAQKYPHCRSVINRPTAIQLNENKQHLPPNSHLYLQYVHGYSGESGAAPLLNNGAMENNVVQAHNANHHVGGSGGKLSGSNKGKNVRYLKDGRIIYPAAALVVLMNIESNEQSYFSGHTDDVTCFAINPTNESVVASGQLGKDGRILVWNSSNVVSGKMLTQAPLELFISGNGSATDGGPLITTNVRGIFSLDFSPDGKYLLAVGMDDAHTVVVFDWKRGNILTSNKIGHVDVNQVQFNKYLYDPIEKITPASKMNKPVLSPRDILGGDADAAAAGGYTIVSTGSRQVKFWTFYRVLERVDQGAVGGSKNRVSSKVAFGGGGGGGLKGKQLATPKRKHLWRYKYVLEGNNGIFPKNTPDIPEFTAFCCVEAAPVEMDGIVMAKSRVYTGTSTGCIYIWKQLEVKNYGKESKANNKKGEEVIQCSCKWLPRGKLLSIVTDIHSEPPSSIIDMDYSGSYNDYIKKHYFYTNKDKYYSLYNSKKKRKKFVEKIVTSGKDGYVNIWKIKRYSSTEIMQHNSVVEDENMEDGNNLNLIPLEHLSSYFVMASTSNEEVYTFQGSNNSTKQPNAQYETGQYNSELNIYDMVYGTFGGVPRSIQWNENCSAVIIGSTTNSIYELHARAVLQTSSDSSLASDTNATNQSSQQPDGASSTANKSTAAAEPAVVNELVLQPIVRGHIGKVTKVAAHPLCAIYATLGTDNSIRIWDVYTRQLLTCCSTVVDRPTALQFSPDGFLLAIGNIHGEITLLHCGFNAENSLGSDDGVNFNNNLCGVDSEDEEVIVKQLAMYWKSQANWKLLIKKPMMKGGKMQSEAQPNNDVGSIANNKQRIASSKHEVTVIKFSPSGSMIAAGCKDSIIYVLNNQVCYVCRMCVLNINIDRLLNFIAGYYRILASVCVFAKATAVVLKAWIFL